MNCCNSRQLSNRLCGALACLTALLSWQSVWAGIPLPQINTNNVINVTSYGAVGNGIATNTTAIQNAINAAAAGGAVNGLRGGTVEIPAGIYLSGPLTMKSYVNLQINAGATLKMLPYGSFPATSDFISASKLHDIEISGGGTIDGQGADWWTADRSTSGGITRPKAMFAASTCTNILVRDVTLQNPPNTHISFRYVCVNVTVDHITINTPDGTPNTDGIDCSGANVLIENSYITDGDDHIAMGDGHLGNLNHDITVTNCLFGTGHGVSIGSYTEGGLTNLLVVNCAWSGSENGIRLKSERGRGGLCQFLTYRNLSMTNVQWPILIYSYYNYGVGTLSRSTPFMAATNAVQTVNATTPRWQNITFSNVTATVTGGRPPIMIWGVPEMLVSNVVLQSVNLSGGTKNCEIYNATGIRFVDGKIAEASEVNTFTLYNAGMAVTSSVATNTRFTFDGLTTNGIGNSLAFYNARASLKNTNALGDGPLTLAASTFVVSNNFALPPSTVLNYQLGTNAATLEVKGNLALSGTNNIAAGDGFTAGDYTLFTYAGDLSGNLPTLGATPAGFDYSWDTNTVGQVKLVVAPPVNSSPTNLMFNAVSNTLELSWPPDHTGWRLQIQTNSLGGGLGTNWFTVLDSTNVNREDIPIDSGNGSVYLRLIYP